MGHTVLKTPWANLLDLVVVTPNRAMVERHEEWASSILAMGLGWLLLWTLHGCLCSVWPTSIWGIGPPCLQVCWADSGNSSQHIYTDFFCMCVDYGFSCYVQIHNILHIADLASLVSCGRSISLLLALSWISPLPSTATSFPISLASSLHSSFVTLNFTGCLYFDLVVIAPSPPCGCFPPFIIRVPCGESTWFRC